MKKKRNIFLIITKNVLVISLIDIISIWLFNQKETNKTTSTQHMEATKVDIFDAKKPSDELGGYILCC
ncbi:hypothetical protein ACSLGG_17480 [Bacillus mycoides]|uniref:hypothetical protein n=1 Tax=Bacillus mycoides TaxID=1405 RepID=UPI003F756FD1